MFPVNADNADNHNIKFVGNPGTIEIIILRCKGWEDLEAAPRISRAIEAKAPAKKAAKQSKRAAKDAGPKGSVFSGGMMGGMFDGAYDIDDPFMGPGGMRPVGKNGYVQPRPPPGYTFDSTLGRFKRVSEGMPHTHNYAGDGHQQARAYDDQVYTVMSPIHLEGRDDRTPAMEGSDILPQHLSSGWPDDRGRDDERGDPYFGATGEARKTLKQRQREFGREVSNSVVDAEHVERAQVDGYGFDFQQPQYNVQQAPYGAAFPALQMQQQMPAFGMAPQGQAFGQPGAFMQQNQVQAQNQMALFARQLYTAKLAVGEARHEIARLQGCNMSPMDRRRDLDAAKHQQDIAETRYQHVLDQMRQLHVQYGVPIVFFQANSVVIPQQQQQQQGNAQPYWGEPAQQQGGAPGSRPAAQQVQVDPFWGAPEAKGAQRQDARDNFWGGPPDNNGFQAVGEGVIGGRPSLNQKWKWGGGNKDAGGSKQDANAWDKPASRMSQKDFGAGVGGWENNEKHANNGSGWNQTPSKSATDVWSLPNKMADNKNNDQGGNGFSARPASNNNNDNAANDGWGNNDNAGGWGNDIKQETDQPAKDGGGWVTAAQGSTHSVASSRTRARAETPLSPEVFIKPYWADWRKQGDGNETPDSNTKKKRETARPVYDYPAPPPPAALTKTAGNAGFGIQTGKGADYAHIKRRPEYIDSMKAPYAIFSFKYRSKEALEKTLKISIDADADRIVAQAEKDKLMNMPRNKLVEELMKARTPQGRKQIAPGDRNGRATNDGWGQPGSNGAPANDGWDAQWADNNKANGSAHGSRSHKSDAKQSRGRSEAGGGGSSWKPVPAQTQPAAGGWDNSPANGWDNTPATAWAGDGIHDTPTKRPSRRVVEGGLCDTQAYPFTARGASKYSHRGGSHMRGRTGAAKDGGVADGFMQIGEGVVGGQAQAGAWNGDQHLLEPDPMARYGDGAAAAARGVSAW